MDLQAGLSFRLAPFFHSRMLWPDRLSINGGIESSGFAVHPRGDWRRLTDAERNLLVAEPGEAPLLPSHAGVVVLPERIRAAWWTLAERAEHLDGRIDGFDVFVAQVLEFFRFKRLPLPTRCRCEVTASRPEQRSTRVNAAGTPAGIRCGFASGPHGMMRAVSVINLGDEATYVVLLNVLLPDLPALLAEQSRGGERSADDVLADFFSVMPEYPLVRVQLSPGEGLWLPAAGVAYDGYTTGKADLDVVLTIWAEDGDS